MDPSRAGLRTGDDTIHISGTKRELRIRAGLCRQLIKWWEVDKRGKEERRQRRRKERKEKGLCLRRDNCVRASAYIHGDLVATVVLQ